ncbi:MAG: hypothetical protein A2516_02110 [Alphaproteobacteria bacterium RIFOXYD12_FULL_60_8]|nr:MAG: hypothetical protein A2516_02110 [Alphaproteobacteria bacterium RIFOXYD12_FULL_60_8]
MARRLKAEALSVLGPERRPTLDDLPDMPYSRMVVEESLRLYPPFWTLSRQVKEDDRLGDYRLPAGATVMISPYVTHRNPRYWDNPEGFDPERFSPERSEHRPKFAYFPFGGGPRVCVGRNMALMEAQLFLAMLVRRYSVSLSPGHKVEPSPMISLRPKNGVRMTVAAAG